MRARASARRTALDLFARFEAVSGDAEPEHQRADSGAQSCKRDEVRHEAVHAAVPCARSRTSGETKSSEGAEVNEVEPRTLSSYAFMWRIRLPSRGVRASGEPA